MVGNHSNIKTCRYIPEGTSILWMISPTLILADKTENDFIAHKRYPSYGEDLSKQLFPPSPSLLYVGADDESGKSRIHRD